MSGDASGPQRRVRRPNREAMNWRALVKFFGFFFLATFMLACSPASADKRVALVVGNSIYKHAPRLSNPANDAAAIAATLKGAGFDIVDTRSNLPSAEMRRALRQRRHPLRPRSQTPRVRPLRRAKD